MDQQENQQNISQQNINQQEICQQNSTQPGSNSFRMTQEVYRYEVDQDPVAAKKILSRAGIALFMMAAVVLAVQGIVEFLVDRFYPAIRYTDWYTWALTACSVVLIGFPTFYLMTKKIPDTVKGEVVKLKAGRFIAIFFICTSAMYISNFFSVILTVMIALLKGDSLNDLNALAKVMANSNIILTVLYAAIVGPIVEELIFRKFLLNKLRRFGDIPAILITGIAFGLFHLNLSQFFYATVLGIIFAYVTIRTNTVKYSIYLHMMINSIGVISSQLAVGQDLILVFIIVLWVFIAIALGVVFFILNIRKIRLYRTTHPMIKVSDYFFNLGTVLYTLLCLVIIAIVTIR